MTFASSLSKGLNVLAIFESVDEKKSRYLVRGRQEENAFASGFCFRKINILDESWKSVKKREKFCVKVSQEKTSWVSRNVWMMAIYGFCLSLFTGFVATSFKPMILIWSYSNVLECVGKVLREMQAYVALGVNFMRNSWFCILVRYCNIVTPILKSKISLLRLIAEELWNIRRSFSWWISLNSVDLQRMWMGVSFMKEYIRR